MNIFWLAYMWMTINWLNFLSHKSKRVLNLSWSQSLVCIVLYLTMVAHLISFFVTYQLQQPLIGDGNTLYDIINLNEKNRPNKTYTKVKVKKYDLLNQP